MKFVTYLAASGKPSPGVLSPDGTRIVDLGAAYPTLLALIEAGPAGLDTARKLQAAGGAGVAMAGAKLLAPLPVPPQIRDFMVSAQHARDAGQGMQRLRAKLEGRPIPERDRQAPVGEIYVRQPVYYISNRFNVVGPDAEVRWPRYCDYLDYELEFGMVIGKGGANIPVEKAREHIFGYTIFNDYSARDRQFREMDGRMGPTKGKSFDTGNGLGPCIVTTDEMTEPYKAKVEVRVNGEVRGRNTTGEMMHNFEQMIAFVSEDETLHPGEVFGSGTIGGCCGLEIDRFLAPGDVVELEIEGIGVLRNRIVRG